jgi:hypothetical protein
MDRTARGKDQPAIRPPWSRRGEPASAEAIRPKKEGLRPLVVLDR